MTPKMIRFTGNAARTDVSRQVRKLLHACLSGLMIVLLIRSTAAAQKSCDYNNRSVFFGERTNAEVAGNVYRICMDKEGFYYPDTLIRDSEIRNNCSSLRQWYLHNSAMLSLLCKKYSVAYDSAAAATTVESLNDAIARYHVGQINLRASACEHCNILIHGFRKKLYGRVDRSSSYSSADNRSLEEKISAQQSRPFFVEVYWDGKFITPLESYKYKGFELFEEAALPNASAVGLSLRKIVPGISSARLNIITHSLGALVACELLFNASSGALKGEAVLPTPAQKIRTLLIAPAIGHSLFNEYYSRLTPYAYRQADNYELAVIYNQNDFVLLKEYPFGIVSDAVTYGTTSLGCNYRSDISKLMSLFKTKFPASAAPVLLDCSLNNSGAPMGCHLVTCYDGHVNFGRAVAFLY